MTLQFENPSDSERKLIEAANRRTRVDNFISPIFGIAGGLANIAFVCGAIVFVGYWVCRGVGCIPG